MQANLLVARFPRCGAPRRPHVGRPCRVSTDQCALPASILYYLMDSNSDVRRHDVCHPQDDFADGCPIWRSPGAQGWHVVRLSHVRQ